MHAKRTAPTFGEDLKVATRLRRFNHSERIRLSGYWKVLRVITGDLKKHASIRTAFVGLARRVQEPRTEAEASGYAFPVSHRMPDGLQRILVGLAHLNESEQREIIARFEAA